MTEIIQTQNSRRTFIDTIIGLAERDDTVVLIVPDVGFNYVDGFEQKFPKRYFNLGVTEYSSMVIATAMAISGLKPYIYSMIPFVTFRVHEQVRNAVCLANANVKILGVLGGPSYKMLGLSHNLIYPTEDVDMMRTLPNMEIYLPKNNGDVKSMILDAYSHKKPSYLRL